MKSILLVFAFAFALAQDDCGDPPNAEALDPTPIATPTPEPKRTTLYLPTGESVVEIRHHNGQIEYQDLEVKNEKN